MAYQQTSDLMSAFALGLIAVGAILSLSLFLWCSVCSIVVTELVFA
jgi:hypothetical protein